MPEPETPRDAPPPKLRRTWTNQHGTQRITPLRTYRPKAVDHVGRIVAEAENAGVTVRAVGSGHSWSDIALTPGYLVETHALDRALPVDCARAEVDISRLVRSEAGVRLATLGKRSQRSGLALEGMGGAGQQTLAGVLATSTHGSGLAYGPLCDQVRSIDLVASGGRIYRIEATRDNITDPAKFRAVHPNWVLQQNDEWFQAAKVGLGCLGIVYAVTLVVQPFYYLNERRHTAGWSAVSRLLAEGRLLRENDHVEIYVNPHRRRGDHLCLITSRNRATGPGVSWAERHRPIIPALLGTSALATWATTAALVKLQPEMTPWVLDHALQALCDSHYVDKWYRVLSIGRLNRIPAYSMEIGVAIDYAGGHIEAVETVLHVAARHRRLGNVYSSCPIALRFVRRSNAFLSMMSGRDTMMVELIQLAHTPGGVELLAAYEEALYGLGGRPHWGQYNTLSGGGVELEQMYPELNRWLVIYSELNSSGVFDSPFAKRVGLTRTAVY